MRRTVWLPLTWTLWWLLLGSAVEAAAERPRPNLIVLLTDDQRWDTLGCYGNRIIHTPHLDALAARGVTFDRAFVTTSICAPNRACILTGQYCARHGMWEFDRELPPEQLAQTYLALLKQAGYRTGFIGKYGVGNPPDELLDFNRAFPGQGNFVVRQSDGTTIHLDRLMGLQAVEFLEGCRPDQPFQLSVSFKGPHVQDSPSVKSVQYPYDPEREIAELYRDITIPPPPTANSDLFERFPDFIKNSENRSRWAVRYWGPERTQESLKGYYRLISGVDLAVGRIVATLGRLGLAENTVIVFTSDHGQYLGDYGLAGKWYPHEVSIRVPLIVHDPRLPESRRGVRTQEFALSIDLAPTLLDLAGVDIPPRMQGRSLVPLLRGETPSDWRQEFFYEHHFVPPWEGMSIPRSEAIRTHRWKYIQYIDSRPLFEELYDLEVDPLETVNLATRPEQAERIEQFRHQLVMLRAAVQ